MFIELFIYFECTINNIIPKRDTFNPTSAFNSAINATWSVFWNDQYQAFSENDPHAQ